MLNLSGVEGLCAAFYLCPYCPTGNHLCLVVKNILLSSSLLGPSLSFRTSLLRWAFKTCSWVSAGLVRGSGRCTACTEMYTHQHDYFLHIFKSNVYFHESFQLFKVFKCSSSWACSLWFSDSKLTRFQTSCDASS